MAPKCDMVVKKLISSDLIYFYLTPNITAEAFILLLVKMIMNPPCKYS